MPSSHLLILVGAIIVVSLLLSTAPAARAEGEGYGYIPGTPEGPENWGNLKPEWATCSTGKRQSPINLALLDLTLAPGLGYLNYTYQNANASVVNRGNDISVRFDGDVGSLVINAMAYQLRQMHWHTPSEHTIDGKRYDMELHMVHLNAQNEAAVIGILYDVGIQCDEFLYKVRSVSPTQLALLKAAVLAGYENNARPLQEVNKREIDLFIPLPLIN
ncbi:hypothetical protein GUJ93_ZPchr0008g12667 [Zizania palustris]|uniref:Carbonic anhydrase n=1 Tax=Zizania palustris TaxID=103762 RepID=A0A8J5VJZ3_ZIZPA|nr:hypothetical protein GUJ93_ZPchr0008g12667 [Zizania palustris]